MSKTPGYRKLPLDTEPVVAQAILNLAMAGLLAPEFQTTTLKLTGFINRQFDHWARVRSSEVGDSVPRAPRPSDPQ